MTTDRPHCADDHEDAARWAIRLAAADGDEGRDELEQWLESDPANVDRLDDVLQSWAAVEHYASAEPIIALREAALAKTRTAPDRDDWHGWTWRGALAAASIIVCAISAGIWMMMQPTVYRTAIGERRVVLLDDGSTLSLDAATQLTVDYAHGRRDLVIDQGRAKFTVAKDPMRPFSVRAGSKVIVATGTQFSVERVGDDVRVILYEGHVAILDGQGNSLHPVALVPAQGKGGRAAVLAPDQAVNLPAAAPLSSAEILPADPVQSLTWESGQLVFVDQPLAEVVERVNRYAERPLRIGDDGARRIRVSGVFRAGETAGLTEGLAASFDARIVPEPNAIAIFSSPHP